MEQVRWDDVEPTVIDGAEVRRANLGDVIAARYRLPAGYDPSGRYATLPDGLCPCEHLGQLLEGRLAVRFADGRTIEVAAGSAFRLPRGHVARALEDSVLLEFTSTAEQHRKDRRLAEHLADALL